ncbi:MAG: fibronectin type III domain-containing protein, partial [bacterium]
MYYFGIRVYDFEGNQSLLSNIASMQTSEEAPPIDTVPPNWVYLELIEVGYDMAMVGWFASGDDGWEGTAEYYLFGLSNRNINAFNWDSLEHFPGPVPEPAGTYQRFILYGLIPGETYYIACKVYDDAGNVSRISNTLRFTTYSTDNIPPAPIVDLRITSFTERTAELSWTAPGDDGHMGRCTRYELRYSTFPITELNWATTHELSDPPEPLNAGLTQYYTVNGLSPGTLYYFAVRSYDDTGNRSGISNVASCWTAGIIRAPEPILMYEDSQYCPAVWFDTLFSPPGITPYIRFNSDMITATVESLNRLCIFPRDDINGNTLIEISWSYMGRNYGSTLYVNIMAVNDPPYFTTEPSCTLAIVGVEWVYDANAQDIDGDTLTYTLIDAPSGMTVEPSTGIIRFIPPPYLEGSYRVVLVVSDGIVDVEQGFNVFVMKESHPNFAPYGLTCEIGVNGSIPIRWQPPQALQDESFRSMNLILSHYVLYRSESFSSGFSVIADSILTTTYNDATVENGRVYYYKVRAVYRRPYFISNYSNNASGVATSGRRFYSTYIWHNMIIDGNLTVGEWTRGTRTT